MAGLSKQDRAILDEARKVTGNPNLKNADVVEWTTGQVEAHEGETAFSLPNLGVQIAVKTSALKPGKGKNADE